MAKKFTQKVAEQFQGEEITIPSGYTHIGENAFNYNLQIKNYLILYHP